MHYLVIVILINSNYPTHYYCCSTSGNHLKYHPIQLQPKGIISSCTTAAGKTEFGLGLFPEEVNFGVIDILGIYSQTVNVRNNGIKPARLKVKLSHGTIEMKLKYAPGPVSFHLYEQIN